jgi:hypothetical protein
MVDVEKPSSHGTGTKVEQGLLSFVKHTCTKRGRRLSTNYFAVEPMDYGSGWKEGARCFREYMQYLKGKDYCGVGLIEFLRELAIALDEGKEDRYKSDSRRGAAVGFLREMEWILIQHARQNAAPVSASQCRPAPIATAHPLPRPAHLRLVWSAPQ